MTKTKKYLCEEKNRIPIKRGEKGLHVFLTHVLINHRQLAELHPCQGHGIPPLTHAVPERRVVTPNAVQWIMLVDVKEDPAVVTYMPLKHASCIACLMSARMCRRVNSDTLLERAMSGNSSEHVTVVILVGSNTQ